MVNNRVKAFDSYGGGWIFNTNRSVHVDLSKLEIGKGYTLFIEHFGICDPILGDSQNSDIGWESDIGFLMWLLKTTNKESAFLQNKRVMEVASDRGISDLGDILDACIERDPDYYIRNVLEELKLCKDYAVFGVTDEEYMFKLAVDANIDLNNSKYVDIKYLG